MGTFINICQKDSSSVKIRRNIRHFTWRPKYMSHCSQSHVAQQNKREITVSFPWKQF